MKCVHCFRVSDNEAEQIHVFEGQTLSHKRLVGPVIDTSVVL